MGNHQVPAHGGGGDIVHQSYDREATGSPGGRVRRKVIGPNHIQEENLMIRLAQFARRGVLLAASVLILLALSVGQAAAGIVIPY